MKSGNAPKLSKVERLALAAKAATILRNTVAADDGRKKIKTPTGKVYSLKEWRIKIIEKQLLEAGIEIDLEVSTAFRPLVLRCECGIPYLVPTYGGIPKRCPICALVRKRERKRRWCETHLEAVRERQRERMRRYRETHLEAVRERSRESMRRYRETHLEAVRERQRESNRRYYEAHREAVRERRRYRAKKKAQRK